MIRVVRGNPTPEELAAALAVVRARAAAASAAPAADGAPATPDAWSDPSRVARVRTRRPGRRPGRARTGPADPGASRARAPPHEPGRADAERAAAGASRRAGAAGRAALRCAVRLRPRHAPPRPAHALGPPHRVGACGTWACGRTAQAAPRGGGRVRDRGTPPGSPPTRRTRTAPHRRAPRHAPPLPGRTGSHGQPGCTGGAVPLRASVGFGRSPRCACSRSLSSRYASHRRGSEAGRPLHGPGSGYHLAAPELLPRQVSSTPLAGRFHQWYPRAAHRRRAPRRRPGRRRTGRGPPGP